jgi:hypothetical protein
MSQPGDERHARSFDEVVKDLDKLRGDLQGVVHGDYGHAGLTNLMDDIYGNEKRQRRGLIPRLVQVEQQITHLTDLRTRDVTLMKGVAIGVGYVVADTAGVFTLIAKVFGAIAP